MIEYLGNSNHLVDWDKFIKQLQTILPMVGYQFSEDRAESQDPRVVKIASDWTNAGYNMIKDKDSSISWEAWYSGLHFDSTITDKICDYLGIIPIDVSMVTRITPGRFAPWHWDIRDNATEERFESYGKSIIRVHIHMSRPEPGHVFVVGDHCFYNEEQGSIYRWPNWKSYHGGANCGFKCKYQFSIIGVLNQ